MTKLHPFKADTEDFSKVRPYAIDPEAAEWKWTISQEMISAA